MPGGSRAAQAVLLGLLLLLLVLLLAFLWFVPEPAPSHPVPVVRAAAAATAPRTQWVPRPRKRISPTLPSPVVSSPKVEPPPPERVEAASVEGDTPFQRRLMAGLAFRRFPGRLVDASSRIAELRSGTPMEGDQKEKIAELSPEKIREVRSILERLSRPLEELSDHLLELEQQRRALRNLWTKMFHAPRINSPRSVRWYEKNAIPILSSFLEDVLHPAADPAMLRLGTSSMPRDRLGTGALVRCWTLRETSTRDALTSSEIRTGEEMLRHLCSFTDHSIPAGIDVLVTPELDVDVFPGKLRYPWANGLYHIGDRFCSVRSGLTRSYRKEVLKHELVHAFLHEFTPEFSELRFIHEGLAVYLRHLSPGDEGLRIPIDRFCDDFAELVSIVLRLRGRVVLEQMDPRRLLRLPPDDFYALRHFSYRVAEAAMVFIGSPVVEQALSERSDRQIIAAVENIRWSDLLAFVEEHAARGDPARAVTDDDAGVGRGRGEVQDESDEGPGPASVLARMGVDVQEGFSVDSALFTAEHRERSDMDSLLLLLEELRRSEAPVVILRDASERMDVPLGASGRSRGDYIDEFLQWLQANWGRQSTVTGVLAIETDPAGAERLPYTASGVPDWLENAKLRQENLVLCVGSLDMVLRRRLGQASGRAADKVTGEDLAIAYRELFLRGNVQPRAVLVVHAGGGESDALPLAQGIAASQPQGTLVVYWGPPGTR